MKLEQRTWLSLAKILGERGEILVKSLFENVRKAQGVVRQPGSTKPSLKTELGTLAGSKNGTIGERWLLYSNDAANVHWSGRWRV